MYFLFNLSLSSGAYPFLRKTSYVYSIFKSGDKSLAINYRPVSKLSSLLKLLERLIELILFNIFNPIIIDQQHDDFQHGKLKTTNLLCYYAFILNSIKTGGQVVSIYTDLKKVFNLVNINRLIYKLHYLGVGGSLNTWFES